MDPWPRPSAAACLVVLASLAGLAVAGCGGPPPGPELVLPKQRAGGTAGAGAGQQPATGAAGIEALLRQGQQPATGAADVEAILRQDRLRIERDRVWRDLRDLERKDERGEADIFEQREILEQRGDLDRLNRELRPGLPGLPLGREPAERRSGVLPPPNPLLDR